MSWLKLGQFGKLGVVQDTPSQALDSAAWSDSLNVRFVGRNAEKMLESAPLIDDAAGRPSTVTTGTDCKFAVGWSDGFSTYLLAVFRGSDGRDYPFRWDQRVATPGASSPVQWEYIGPVGGYDAGYWQGFPWGDTVIINNNTGAPQIFDKGQLQMVDLPGWGLISNAQDITENGPPSVDTQSRCRLIVPYKNYLVALNVTETGSFGPNKVWVSDAFNLANIDNAPSWDYESPTTLSLQREVGVGFGDIVTAERLNNSLLIYTAADCTAMTEVGGRFVMDFRRLFNYGAAGLHTVVEFENKHFVISRDRIYVHDGSTPVMPAKNRVEEEFFDRIGARSRIEVR